MRLRDIRESLAAARPGLIFKTSPEGLPGNHTGTTEEATARLIASAKMLLPIPVFGTRHGQRILTHKLITQIGSRLIGSTDEVKVFQSSLEAAVFDIDEFIQVLDAVLAPDDSCRLSIRLPDISTFSELKDVITDLQVIAERTVLNQLPGSGVEISGFDTGTFWLELKLDQEGLILLLSLFSLAAAYLQRMRSIDHQAANLLSDLPKGKQDEIKKALQETLPARKSKLAKKLNPKKEHVNETEDALERAAKLLGRNVEIRLSLKAPLKAHNELSALQKTLEESAKIEQLTTGDSAMRLMPHDDEDDAQLAETAAGTDDEKL